MIIIRHHTRMGARLRDGLRDGLLVLRKEFTVDFTVKLFKSNSFMLKHSFEYFTCLYLYIILFYNSLC